MLSRAVPFVSVSVAVVANAGTALAHPGHAAADALGSLHHAVHLNADMLPVAVVIGLGALAWLWAHRPQPKAPQLAPARKPRDDRKRR